MIDITRLMFDDGEQREPLTQNEVNGWPVVKFRWRGRTWKVSALLTQDHVNQEIENCIAFYPPGENRGGFWDLEKFLDNPEDTVNLWCADDRPTPGILEFIHPYHVDDNLVFFKCEEVTHTVVQVQQSDESLVRISST